jgi:hypothetical protein
MPYRLLVDEQLVLDVWRNADVRLNTGHREPKIPKVVRLTAGKMRPKTAPGRALSTRIGPTSEYPMMTQRNAYLINLDLMISLEELLTCHHVKPALIIEEAMTKVLRLKLSAIQKETCYVSHISHDHSNR